MAITLIGSTSIGTRMDRQAGDPPTLISMGATYQAVDIGQLTVGGLVVSTTGAITLGPLTISTTGLISGTLGAAVVTANGASMTPFTSSELLTLSTTTTVTTSAGNLLPANSVIDAVLTNCQVAILTATSYKVGDPTSDARFLTFTTSIGLNQASVGLNQLDPALATTKALSSIQVAATTVKITTAAATPPTAGKVRITVFGRTFAGPTS